MYRREPRHQLSFEEFFLPFGGKLSGNNRWIQLHALIPWDELEDDYASQFCRGFGAPAKPFQMALGVLIINTRLRLTDDELVEPPAVRKVVARAFDHAGAYGEEQCVVTARLSKLTSGSG